MKLVTYQPLNTTSLHTGILQSNDVVIDIGAEVTARNSHANITTMLDIIEGGEATMALLRDIVAAPKTTPIALNIVLLKSPIPRPRKNVFCVG